MTDHINATKYWATINVNISNKSFKKGDAVFPDSVSIDGISVYVGESPIGPLIKIPFEVFNHAFSQVK